MAVATGTALAIGAAGTIGANVVGSVASSGDRDKAAELYQQGMDEIMAIGAPPDAAREIILNKFDQAGLLTPEVEAEINLGASQVQQIKEDESLKEAQMNALGLIGERAKGGLTAEDRAALEEVRNEVESGERGRQEAIMQQMARQGMSGSGAALAAKLSSSQASTERAADQSDRLAAMASANALQAAREMGTLGGQIRGQDFSVNQARASAADQIAAFNAQQGINRQTRNVERRQGTQQFNVSRQQQVADANTAAANQELKRQRQAEQWEYEAALQRAGARSKALQGAAAGKQADASATQQMWGGIGSGIGSLAGGITAGNPYTNYGGTA